MYEGALLAAEGLLRSSMPYMNWLEHRKPSRRQPRRIRLRHRTGGLETRFRLNEQPAMPSQ